MICDIDNVQFVQSTNLPHGSIVTLTTVVFHWYVLVVVMAATLAAAASVGGQKVIIGGVGVSFMFRMN